MKTLIRSQCDVKVMYKVPYKVYAQLTKVHENRHLKMAYHDGTLEIVSPRLRQHEEPSVKFRWIVTAVSRHLGIVFHCSAGATFRRGGGGIRKGVGKEADESFYVANVNHLPRDRDIDLDAGDPPPDLWIEVDNRVSSKGRLPVYATLGVPEVWRFRARSKSLDFLRLVDGAYESIDRSLSFPMLTPSLVLEALSLGNNPVDFVYLGMLDEWVLRTFPIPRAGH
jgi:Uma2 family endonuclease